MNSGTEHHVLISSKPRAFLCADDRDQGACRRRRSAWNYVTILLSMAVLVLGSALLALQLYRSKQMEDARSEIDAMRREMENLNHRVGELELWDQLKAFEAAVYAEEAATDDDDEDSDDNTSDDDNDYDLDYDVDEDVTRHENKQLHHPADKHKDVADRAKREIDASVPEVPGSYGVELKQHNSSKGLHLYESLVSSADRDWSSTENPIKSYHRVSPLWSSKSQHKKYVGAPEAPVHRRSQPGSTQAPSPIISRAGRVMQTDPKDHHIHHPPPPPPLPKVHKLPDGEVVVRVYQEQRAPETGVVSGPGDVAKTRRRKKRPPHKSLPLNQAPRLLTAVHYEGNSSRYEIGHEHYKGNGRLRHPDGKFMDWSPSSWSQHLGLRNFQLQDGEVTVRDSGIYFIYAQIYYVDEHDINGFRVYVNNNPIFHCTTMTVHSPDDHHKAKANTCHTSGATYLSERDKVSLRDVNGLRYSLFEPSKSFFGLIKLTDAKLK